MDYSAISTSEFTSPYRDPCIGTNAPLVGVIDFNTGAQYCSGTGGTLNNPSGKYDGMTNSLIRQQSEAEIFASPPWQERRIGLSFMLKSSHT